MTRIALLAALLLAPCALAQGMLIPTDAALGPLGVKYQRVSVEIKDGTAVTKVEQVFVNDAPRQLEAHYVFPLPKGAALQDFYLWINGTRTKGEILEKDKAANIYEGIVRRLQDPGLLEYIDTDAFRVRVFPVPARGEQKIELTFSQVLQFDGGVYLYHYPLGASAKGAPALKVRQDFTFSAKVSSSIPLRSIYSPTHTIGVARKGENEAVVGLEQGPGFDISKDLDLYFTVSKEAVGFNLITHRPNGEEPGYFLALIAPRTEVQKEEIIGKRVTFVIDTSGSMMGDRIKLARDALKYCVQRLNPKDEFNVIRFSTDVEALFKAPQAASPEAVKKALDFVAGLEAIGGTAIDEALQLALKDGEKLGDRSHMVLFITDGNPTVGETDEDKIAKGAKANNRGKSRVFTFGVGDELNARLLDRVAEDGQGVSDFVRDGKEFEVKISNFYDKVSYPVLSELSLELGGLSAFDLYPRRLGDLFKGQQLVLMGRYREPGKTTALIKGNVNGAPKVYEYPTSAAKVEAGNDFIPRLWAIRKVGYLIDEIRLRGEKAELKQEIVTLGKKFGIVTPYTSYLVVEDTPALAVNRPPPPPMRSFGGRDDREEDKRAPMADEASASGGGFSDMFRARAPAKGAVAPAAAALPAPEPRRALEKAEGADGVAVAKTLRGMKDVTRGPGAGEPVRVAAGRTFVWRNGWVDSEAVDAPGKQLKVKALSEAYFALLKARPGLKEALALGDRVTVVIAKGLTIAISPDGGETSADKVKDFLK